MAGLNASCNADNSVQVLIDLPIEEDKIISIFNLSNGMQVYEDTLRSHVVLHSLSYGIHLLTIMWDRDVLSPEEYRSLRPQTLDNPTYYSIRKLVFIDPKQGGPIRIYTPDGLTKEDIEEQLLSGNRVFTPLVDVQGRHAQLYEEYEAIQHRYGKQFYQQRDSLQKLLYEHNDKGELQQAATINLQIKGLWENTVLPQLDKEEKRFLIEHADHVVVPFILHNRISDQETYLSFKPVIDALPEKYQKLGFMQDLSKLRSKDKTMIHIEQPTDWNHLT